MSASEVTPISVSSRSAELVVWSLSKRVVFRLLFYYVVMLGLFCTEFMAGLPWYYYTKKELSTPLDSLWSVLVPWAAKYILQVHRAVAYAAMDSGDSLSDYVSMFLWALTAVLATAVWTVLDRKRPNYARLDQWLRLFAVFVLAGTLFSYGLDKVYPVQFGDLTPSTLLGRVGDMEPMDMLWTFMAASKPYTIFSGCLEVVAGIFLLVPRLRFLGALLAITVMTNVFSLNVAYDVSVKALSLHYLLLAIFLAAPEFPMLAKLLVLRRPVAPARDVALSDNRNVERGARVTQAVLASAVFVANVAGIAKDYSGQISSADRSPLEGVWKVADFQVSGDPLHPLFPPKVESKLHLTPGEDHWARLVFGKSGGLAIECADGQIVNVIFKLQKDKVHGDLEDYADKNWKGRLTLQQDGGKLSGLQGDVNGVGVEAKVRLENPKFKLNTAAHHFIQDW